MFRQEYNSIVSFKNITGTIGNSFLQNYWGSKYLCKNFLTLPRFYRLGELIWKFKVHLIQSLSYPEIWLTSKEPLSMDQKYSHTSYTFFIGIFLQEKYNFFSRIITFLLFLKKMNQWFRFLWYSSCLVILGMNRHVLRLFLILQSRYSYRVDPQKLWSSSNPGIIAPQSTVLWYMEVILGIAMPLRYLQICKSLNL